MKKSRFLVLPFFVVTLAFFSGSLFSGCNMPVGLGSRVNTDVPEITTPPDGGAGRAPGGFLRGSENLLQYVVEQEFGIDHVFVTVLYTNRDGIETERVIPATENADGLWELNIDTEYPPPGMADGDIRVKVTAVDNDGNSTTTTDLIYVVMNFGPFLSLTLPDGLRETVDETSRAVTGTVSFVGTVSAHSVRMYYALGVTETAFVEGRDAEDNTGWTNTNLHTVTPRQGHQRWNAALTAHEILNDLAPARVIWSGDLDLTGNWMWRFANVADILDPYYYVEPLDPLDPDGDLWVLPIKFRLVDAAGNVNITKVSVLVDPVAGLPVTTIVSHYDGQIVGGPVRVSGTASDDEVIYDVQMRIFRQSDLEAGSNAPPSEELLPWTTITSGEENAFISWTTLINEFGELDPPAGRNTRHALLEFRSRDALLVAPGTPNDYGRVVTILLVFDNSAPLIGTPIIMRGRPSEIGAAAIDTAPGEYFDFVNGSLLSGFATMRVVVQAQAGLQTIRLRGGTVNVDLRDGVSRGFNDTHPWLSARRPFGEAGHEYTLFIPFNTDVASGGTGATLFGSGFAGSAASFNLELHLADYTTPSPFTALTSYTVRVDNRPPLGRYTGVLNVINPSYTISGDAWDHGSGVHVHGIERVVVYFSRPGSANDGFGTPVLLTGVESSASSAGWETERNVRVNRAGTYLEVTAQGTSRDLPFFPTNFTSTGTGLEITQAGVSAFQHLGLSGGGSLGSPPLHSWFVNNFDLSGFADGPLTVNFVIFDHAGNATFYAQDIFLAINRPVIRRVYLGTDIGGGTSFTPRDALYDPINANFRIRNNNFSLRFDVTNPAGDPLSGGLTYDVAHVTLRSASAIPASEMVEGGVYRIATRGTATGANAMNWVSYGVLVDLTTLVGGNLIDPVGITFVATRNGSAASSGTVFAYDVPAPGPRRLQGAWAGPATQVTFGAASFTGNPRPIPDSAKVSAGGVNFVLQNDRFFVIRVTDSIGITNTALVRLDVHNDDITPPAINIAEFGQRSVGAVGLAAIANFADRFMTDLLDSEYNMNIVTNLANARRGYVQYAAHNTRPGPEGGRADISGRVIFRGNAADNDRVQSIAVSIGGAPPIQVATWGTTGLEPVGGNTIAAMRADSSTAEWGFNASYQISTLDYGHVLNWEFAWDSSRFPSVVGINVPITFTVTDFAGLTASRTIHVNIVPYITEIVTPLTSAFAANPSAFNRSARGWYPVREDDIITIRGFNLSGGPATSAVFLNNTDLVIDGTPTSTEVRANIGQTVESGPLELRFGAGAAAIVSLNNRNNNAAHYNREPNNYNNNILTDDRYLYVWQTGFLLNEPQLATPVMRMQPDGTWFLAYGLFGAGNIGTGTQNANTARVIRAPGNGAAITDTIVRSIGIGNNRFNNVVLASDGVDWFVGSSNIDSSQGHLQNFFIAARDAAGAFTAAPGGTGNDQGNNHRNLIRLGHAGVGDITRIVTPSLFAQNTTPGGNVRGTAAHPTRVLVSYFDTIGNNNALFFRYGLIGGPTTATGGWGGNFPNSATFNTTSHLFPPAIPGPASTPPLPASSPQVVASNQTTHQGSNHVAVGALSNGLPVIAWFDRANQTLVFSHGQNAPSTYSLAAGATSISNNTTQVWQGNARVIHNGGGTHVSMAIDGNDVIHLAFQDLLNGGGLFYARIYPMGAGSGARPDMDDIHVARVDTHAMAGTRSTISVRRETHNLSAHGIRTFYVPYISYFHNAFSDTRNPIRVAWLRPDAAGNMSVRHGTFGANNLPLLVSGHIASSDFPANSFTGEWEIMTVPANRLPFSGEFVGIGVPETGSFFAPTNSGGIASNLARSGSFAATANALNRSILVGYRTVNYFEGAVLKYRIWE